MLCWYSDVKEWLLVLWPLSEKLGISGMVKDLVSMVCSYLAHPRSTVLFHRIASAAEVTVENGNVHAIQKVRSNRQFDFALGATSLRLAKPSFTIRMDQLDTLLFVGFARTTLVNGLHRERCVLYYDGQLSNCPTTTAKCSTTVAYKRACQTNRATDSWQDNTITVTADLKNHTISFKNGTTNFGTLFYNIPDAIMQDLTPFISFRFQNRTVYLTS